MELRPIDVWDAATFDEDLTAVLDEHASLIQNHMTTDHEIFLAYDCGKGPGRPLIRPDNPYWRLLRAPGCNW